MLLVLKHLEPMLAALRQHAVTAWKSGLRGRTFHAVFVFALLLLTAAWLAAAFSARQPQAVALDVGLSGIRISMTFLALIWVQELVGREIERRTVFLVLAYPMPRAAYILGRYLGILLLAAAAILLLGVILLAVIQISAWGYQYPHALKLGWPYWATIVGFFVDIAVVSAFTLAVATVSSSAIFPLIAGAGFSLACRMLGPVLDYLSRGAEGDKELVRHFDPLVSTIRWLIPDLDRLDLRLWPMFGTSPVPDAFLVSVAMASCYAALMLLLAVHAFNRRQFV
ncbi:ABC transporter permease subunit [Thauera sp. 2A1]|uniref:ABC transporter permease subunit n=1 Tax=Thauera sp. 2A1 TaxID=2570191 RepID=UPI00129104DF|nr:ABC transporter permease subunit [Thauera sp. 2A1]KAI5916293.1 ABC transporter permease subunit [Thauera sp. 2A1]